MKRKIKFAVAEADVATRGKEKRNKGVILKNCVPFFDFMSKINNNQVDNTKDLDAIQKHLEVYRNVAEMSQMLLYQILNHSNPR